MTGGMTNEKQQGRRGERSRGRREREREERRRLLAELLAPFDPTRALRADA